MARKPEGPAARSSKTIVTNAFAACQWALHIHLESFFMQTTGVGFSFLRLKRIRKPSTRLWRVAVPGSAKPEGLAAHSSTISVSNAFAVCQWALHLKMESFSSSGESYSSFAKGGDGDAKNSSGEAFEGPPEANHSH